MASLLRLENKTALITGAASGIGHGIARLFVAEGAHVAVADLREQDAAATAKELAAQGPGKAFGLAMDVSDEAAVNAGVAKAIATMGQIDILINNAGIQIVHPVEEFPFAEWKKMLAIHLDGAFLTTKAVLPHMYGRKTGTLLYMGSVHSKEASPLKSAYVTAKHGILGFARTVAKEAGPHGVRANVLCPGFVKTPLVEKQIPEQAKALGISEKDVIAQIMLGGTVDKEFTTVEDVAEAALFFATFPTNALTGQSLNLSHGWSMS